MNLYSVYIQRKHKFTWRLAVVYRGISDLIVVAGRMHAVSEDERQDGLRQRAGVYQISENIYY